MLLETVPALGIVWFLLITVLWVGFFFLEGFDFGVGMLLPVLGTTEKKRRVMINTIGPVWDGNEVWLLTAGGAMFAAFPGWYASLFSALYLPLFLVLVGLILRGVAFEYRAKHDDDKWRSMFDWFATIGSLLPSLVLGIGFANMAIGLANDGTVWKGSFLGLFGPFALLGGVLFVAIFLTHGAAFISLKTKGEIHNSAKAFASRVGVSSVVLLAAYVILQNVFYPAVSEFADLSRFAWVTGIVSIVALAAGVFLVRKGRDGWAFLLTGTSIATLIITIFLRLYGNLGFAQDPSLAVGERLNIITAASSPTTLTIMTWAAVIFVPIVIAYQAWSYWVFHKRISTKNIPDVTHVA
ncbi:MAG: cytochrome d ubiquinol oxidase subunit II [Arachnia sp.]